MENYMMQKGIEVLFYADSKTLLKVKKLSKQMGKRVDFIQNKNKLSKIRTIHFDSLVTRKEHFNRLSCFSGDPMINLMEEGGEINLGLANFIVVKADNLRFYSEFTASKVKCLHLENLNFDQTKVILGKIKEIVKIRLIRSETELNLLPKSLEWVEIIEGSLKNTVRLPFLKNLEVKGVDSFEFIVCSNLVQLKFDSVIFTKTIEKWLSSLRKVKELTLRKISNLSTISCFPSKIRHFDSINSKLDSDLILKTVERLKSLISLKCDSIKLSSISNLKLRMLGCTLVDDYLSPSLLRLREAQIDAAIAETLNNHPEMLTKAAKISIDTKKFNLDCLPSKIKELSIWRVNEESAYLTRFS